jgi:hypothetical protein
MVAIVLCSGLLAHGQQDTSKQKSEDKVKSPNERFLRIRRDAKGRPVAMETSVVRYETENDDGEKVIVDLIGAIHVGGDDYY